MEFTDINRFGDSVKEILLSEKNPDLKALVISKFVKKVEGKRNIIPPFFFENQKLS